MFGFEAKRNAKFQASVQKAREEHFAVVDEAMLKTNQFFSSTLQSVQDSSSNLRLAGRDLQQVNSSAIFSSSNLDYIKS